MIELTLPHENRKLKAGDVMMIGNGWRKEHFIKSVTYEHRSEKIVTIVELTPYDEFDGKHRDRIDTDVKGLDDE